MVGNMNRAFWRGDNKKEPLQVHSSRHRSAPVQLLHPLHHAGFQYM